MHGGGSGRLAGRRRGGGASGRAHEGRADGGAHAAVAIYRPFGLDPRAAEPVQAR